MTFKNYIFLLILTLISHTASAQIIIPDSYIVTFKSSNMATASVIESATSNSKNNSIKVPFGEPITGQSKEALRSNLKITGKVINIYDKINSAYLKVNSVEVEKLKKILEF